MSYKSTIGRRAILLVATLGFLSGGCGPHGNQGDLGKVNFAASSCGLATEDPATCDLKLGVAVGGLVDVRATRISDGMATHLRSDHPDILEVRDNGDLSYTLRALGVGTAVLSTSDADFDQLTLQLFQIDRIAYDPKLNLSGAAKFLPEGDADGILTIPAGADEFCVSFVQVNAAQQALLGRNSFSWELSSGLQFQSDAPAPQGLRFNLRTPSLPGIYSLSLRANHGAAALKLKIPIHSMADL